MPVITSQPRRERGLAVVVFALVLIALLVFMAFAVDLGAVYNHRRLDQNAADASALAAAQDISSEATAVATAKSYAHMTLDVTLPDDAWDSCATDSGALAHRAASANCISFDRATSPTRVRVRLPEQAYATTFGQVVGLDSVAHSAFAVAGLSPAGFGGVLPFGLTNTAGDGGHACLKTGPNGPSTPVCQGTAGPGNFGFLSFSVHGPDRTRDCSPTQDSVTINNIAIGVDHDLSVLNGPPHNATVVVDDATCPDRPNAAEGDTGNVPSKLGTALYSGADDSMDDGLGPRLRRGTFGARTTIEGNSNVDDNPLWSYIPPALTAAADDIPESCQRNQFVDATGTIDTSFPNVAEPARTHILNVPGSGTLKTQNQMIKLMERCFAHWAGDDWNDFGATSFDEAPGDGCAEGGPSCGVLFGVNSSTVDTPDLQDIQYSPRFGYVPELQSTSFCSGSNCANAFVDFRAIYIQRMCIGNVNCDFEFDPGFALSSSGGENRANSLTAWVFHRGMLPNGLDETGAPFAVGKNRFVSLLR